MRLLLPMLVVILVNAPEVGAQNVGDFVSFARAIGKEVSVVHQSGLVVEGVVEAATADDITLKVGEVTQRFPRSTILSADRMKDENADGLAKGLLWGLLFLFNPDGGSFKMAFAIGGMGAVGYLIDKGEINRQPLYRAPAAATPTMKLSWRF